MTEAAVALTAALVVLAVTYAPVRAATNVEQLRRDLATDPDARVGFYRRAVASLPLVTGIYVIVVSVGGETWRDAGISWDEPLRALLASVAGLAGALVLLGATAAAFNKMRPDDVRRASDATKVLAPGSARERALWPFVALTAGVTEELVYRGLFVLHLHALVPSLRPGLLAVLSAVAFGLAHRYQGPFGVVSSGVLGLAFGVIAIVTGNVVVVVVLHALWDVMAGSIKRE